MPDLAPLDPQALHVPFRRLGELVKARALHRGTEFHDPDAWLLHWMHTPRADLDGGCPAMFVAQPDWELVLLGLLLRPDSFRSPSCLRRTL